MKSTALSLFLFLAFALVALLAPSAAAGSEAALSSAQALSGVSEPDALSRAQASYQMDVRLDPAAKTVAGTERITYRNLSDDSLSELWLHLYLRVFRDQNTTWMREAGGRLRGFTADAASLADIEVSSLRLAGGADLLPSATISETLMHVALPQALAPGAAVELDVAWTSRLPRVFARTGYGGRDDTFFMVGQWYPKMAVYDRGRWDTEPWHANSEFFHDFGSYDVTVTLPSAYIAAGVGMPAGDQVTGATRTTHWTAEDVTDFAFAASPDFRTAAAVAGPVQIVLYYLPEHASAVAEYLDTAVGALSTYSDWYGPYPHPRLTLVDVPDNAGGAGGMEYPTLVTGGTIGAPPNSGAVALVVSHEIGHEWWPMQTATHEGREPFLDEGLTEYSSIRYLDAAGRRIGPPSFGLSAFTLDRGEYSIFPNLPATLPAWEYPSDAYVVPYAKTAVGLWTLENVVGTGPFRRALAAYLSQFRFKHPNASDFRASLETSLGRQAWFFDDYLNGRGVIDYGAAPIENSSTASSVTLLRRGSVRVPVEAVVTFTSGASRRLQWDGQGGEMRFVFPAADPITRFQIDPDQKLRAELNVLDNGAAAGPDPAPAVNLGGQLLFWVGVLFRFLGLFG